MPRFAIEKISAINGKKKFYQLKDDCTTILEDFESALKGTQYMSEYKNILSYMDYFSNGGNIPKTKLNWLPTNDDVKEFEFKSDHLRIYGIILPDGHVIILCGFKNAQKKDLVQFRATKKLFLKEKNEKNEKRRID